MTDSKEKNEKVRSSSMGKREKSPDPSVRTLRTSRTKSIDINKKDAKSKSDCKDKPSSKNLAAIKTNNKVAK